MGRHVVWALVLGVGALALWKKSTIQGYIMTDDEMMANPNVIKLYNFIGRYESGQNYTVLYQPSTRDPRRDPNAPTHFNIYDANSPTGYIQSHPNIRIPFTMPDGMPEVSTAAGWAQITHPTWLAIQASRVATGRAPLPDFGPESQMLATFELLRMDGVVPDIVAGNWAPVLKRINKTWASMPNDPTGQSHLAFNTALNQLNGTA